MSDFIVRYDRALNWFLLCFFVLFVVISAVYADVVGAMVGILFFFGFPLIVFVVTYAAICCYRFIDGSSLVCRRTGSACFQFRLSSSWLACHFFIWTIVWRHFLVLSEVLFVKI